MAIRYILLATNRHYERCLASPYGPTLNADAPNAAGIVTVLDGHPATLSWLGAVSGHRVRALGVDKFGQTGSIAELYSHYGIDIKAIVAAAQQLTQGRPMRHLAALW